MKISAKAEYACLAALELARLRPDDPPIRIREISELHAIPERYLVQILLQLKASGLVISTRGALGGYRLARPADSITLSDVLSAIEGPDAPHREPTEPTARALAGVWKLVREAERAVLDRVTIAKLAAQTSPREWVI
jgi:Rrf2 family cysteine metabolism transcriptional repressor